MKVPDQEWTCPVTKVHCHFTFHEGIGWCVSFPEEKGMDGMRKMSTAKIKIPFPETPEEYKKDIEDFNVKLKSITRGLPWPEDEE